MMSSISTQQSNVLQQVGAVQPPPPEDVKQSHGGQTAGLQSIQSTDGRPPPSPPAQSDGKQMGGQSGQPSGADMQSVFEGLLNAADSAATTAVATMTAAAGYGTASAIFA